jgi:hypothetical protein
MEMICICIFNFKYLSVTIMPLYLCDLEVFLKDKIEFFDKISILIQIVEGIQYLVNIKIII